MAFDKNKYINDFRKEHYASISVLVPKEKAPLIREYAKLQGKSMSRLILEALENTYHLGLFE